MKLKKKTVMLISFSLGALLFATTALADMVNKSGYEQLKDGLKVTAEKCSEELDSFTLDLSMEVKNNGETLITSNEVSKFDRSNNAQESFSSQESVYGNDYNSYNYSDDKMRIRWSEDQDTYYVTEFTNERDQSYYNNPFKEEGAEDIERIVDAVVGSLKDHVMVEENSDGGKELSGSLSEMQIPALINAFASFQLKQQFNGRQSNMPHLTQDIFVKEISGKSIINADGIMESMLGTALLSGKDKQGQVHELSFEILVKMSDINNTTVTMPDLTNENVVKEVERPGYGPEITNPEKFQGLFKNDILIEKDGQYVKIGERYINITHIDDSTISGRYYEEYRDDYEQYTEGALDFRFDASFERDGRQASFEYTTETGKTTSGNLYLDEYIGKLNFNINQDSRSMVYDYMFSKVFD
ncbi:MAG: hypothetical protein APF84_11585 [Gracilibacter sp. BRH_c7a]|nr:MAG: hypothetical protein APF84_11585 [Gracilibacter sp. BRH_c7a]